MPLWTATEPFRSLWDGGLDPFAWLESAAAGARPEREIDGRTTFRFEVEGGSYYAKLHRGVSVQEIAKNLLSLRRPVVDAQLESRALRRLERAGVPVPELMASGSDGAGVRRRRSFVVTRDVGTQRSLRDALQELGPPDLWPKALRRKLVVDVARTVRAVHDAGVNHRDLYLVHFLVPGTLEQADPLVLIDLHRAGTRERVPARWRHKDLGGLAFDARELGLVERDLTRFAATYLRSGGAPVRVDWRAVLRRADRLSREKRRKGPRFGR